MWQIISIVVITLFTGGYIGLILYYRNLFCRLNTFQIEKAKPLTRFSVVIPARNEEDIIGKCIESIYRQDYPAELFEVIVIDDHSTDNTSDVIAQLQKKFSSLKLVRLEEAMKGKLLNAYKKKAIDTAIHKTSGEWIVTTDADCIVTNQWL